MRFCIQRFFLWFTFFSLAAFGCGKTATAAENDIAQRIQRGESFLTNLFDARVDLLPEFKGSSTYWLFHDNYLAAHLLERSRPELSQRIRSALVKFGFTNSGKIEIVFDEAAKPLPFRTYVLTNVALVDGKTIRTELVTTNILAGWTEYADLLLLAAVAQARSSPAEAQGNFEKAAAMWDGDGFHDAAARHSGIYATYKLALYLIAADRLHISPPHRDEVIKGLLAMQSPDGGWKTDYKEGKPVGFANVETTCLALLALETLRKSPQPKSDGQIVKVSENGRYFVDQDGQPIFWLGTTQWQLLRDHTLDDTRIIIEKSKEDGFVFAQVMIAGVGDGKKANVNGDLPWMSNDVRTPNEKYFKHVDQVIEIAREQNLILSIVIYHQTLRKIIPLENARSWAKWIAQRHKDVPNIIWALIPEARPEYLPILREVAAGLREGDGGRHLITSEPDPAPHPPGFAHDENWLDFSVIQTWKWVEKIYPMVTHEYLLQPVKPVVMGEGAYEHGSEYGFEVTPLWVRRQAYYSYLAGAHHAYGHNDSWRMLPTWKEALDAPGAKQLGVLKKVFLERTEWWNLAPDQTIFANGGNTNGQILNLAARHKDGKWIMAYLGSKASFSIHKNKLADTAKATAIWINPKTGESQPIDHLSGNEVESFETPDGWEDALLVLDLRPE